jgi:hypothetical protein
MPEPNSEYKKLYGKNGICILRVTGERDKTSPARNKFFQFTV